MTVKTMTMNFEKLLIVFLAMLFGFLCSVKSDPSIHHLTVDESLQYVVSLINLVDNTQTVEDNDISNSSRDILKACQAFLREYAAQSSSFTKCLVENARPFRFCETCVGFYKKASTVFHDMTTDPACSQAILMADRVQVVRLVNGNMENIWQNSFCSDCFANIEEDRTNGTVKYVLTNQTQLFLDLFVNMTECLNDTIQVLDPFEKKTNNDSFKCVKCKTHYQSLNEHFTSMLKDSSAAVCMDVVDMMNYTRLMWSGSLNCSHRVGDLAPVLVITGIICALPVIFYIANRLIRPSTERTIVIQRRMKFPHVNSYGSMSGSEQTLVNSNSQNVESVTGLQIPR